MALTSLKCTVSLCESLCDGVKELVAHLKKLLDEGQPVNCPVKGCKTVFTVKFTFHMFRKHRHCTINVTSGLSVDTNPDRPTTSMHNVTAMEDISCVTHSG